MPLSRLLQGPVLLTSLAVVLAAAACAQGSTSDTAALGPATQASPTDPSGGETGFMPADDGADAATAADDDDDDTTGDTSSSSSSGGASSSSSSGGTSSSSSSGGTSSSSGGTSSSSSSGGTSSSSSSGGSSSGGSSSGGGGACFGYADPSTLSLWCDECAFGPGPCQPNGCTGGDWCDELFDECVPHPIECP